MCLQTPRLDFRRWSYDDVELASQMHADTNVMQHLTRLTDRNQVEAWVHDQVEHHRQHGYGVWILEEKGTGAFVGYCGLSTVSYQAHFTPAVEISWILKPEFWGKGLATEAAEAVIADGFERLGLVKIVATASVANANSLQVMRRLGMSHDARDNFEHPLKSTASGQKAQVLFRLSRDDWAKRHGAS
ncbi:GNAT family N-acetyltransferase [Mesorhizobium sp. M0904]|uniref:GNAT family N-acetyltransferase n=1 Tax=Mesorhizobium sp. M0904 TaxID=2957022 RepID=UPI0033359C3E